MSPSLQWLPVPEKPISIAVGPRGWTHVEWPGGVALVRFVLNRDRKTWRIAELRFVDPTPEAVRSFPLRRIETAANAGGLVPVGLAIGRTQEEPPDLWAFFSKSAKRAAAAKEAGRFLLERPAGRRLEDGFFVRVAQAYSDAVAAGLNPRQTLAKDANTSPDTVARWVGEARRRGFLPPTSPGRVAA